MGEAHQPDPRDYLDLEDEAALRAEIEKNLRVFEPKSSRTRIAEALRAASKMTPPGATGHAIAVALGLSDRMVGYILRELAHEGRLKYEQVKAASISGRLYRTTVYWLED